MQTPSVRAFAHCTAHPLWACWRSGHDDMVIARDRPQCSKCDSPLLRTFPAAPSPRVIDARGWRDRINALDLI